ncbi:MAG TPA: Ig-like domain-containing protein, partial [Ilumatobacteraceae bacterium]
VDLPGDPSEIVVQQPGPPSPCAWVASDDVLWCVGRSGVEQTVEIPGLDVDGADLLGVAGDAAALVHRATRVIDRLDLRGARILADGDGAVASVPQTAELALTATADLVWIDDTAGDLVWAVNPWSLEAIRKNDTTSPLLGETGEVIEEGSSVDSGGPTRPAEGDPGQQERQPDDNGIDDPPVALDDPVTSRVASAIPIAVTANDFDPDGEAVAVVSVDSPAHGTTEVASASVVVYRPDAGFVGVDRFTYTIADGNGTEASATVVIELVAADATNRVPVAQDDEAETGLDTPVVIDVLLNDLDPERDALRIASFTQADVGGTISQTLGPSGLQALRYQPPPGASGTATFTYRPVDAFDAIGEPATVTIDIAEAGSPNRAPITQPDAVRLRRNIPQNVNVLANDRDPDGDTLTLDKVEPLPNGIEVEVAGSELVITSRAGSQPLTPLAYLVDDGHGHVTLGRVLVVTLSDVEPNQPPVAYPDIATAVVGEDRFIDVLANDTDPDGDPLFLVDVDAPAQGGQVSVVNDEVRFVPASIGDNESRTVRFRYTVGDGNGHLVEGDVAVSVLAEPLAL